jgi:hypothetical protein
VIRLARRIGHALAAACLLGLAPAAFAQGLAPTVDVDPPAYPFRIGPLMFAPTVRLQQLGVDTNIFQNDAQAREDFVATVTPEVSLFLRPRSMRVLGYFGTDFNYFQTYADERYVAPTTRLRAEFLLSRLRPYVGVARIDTRDRPNREIDARARHVDTELGGGVVFELSPASFVYAAVTRQSTDYRPGERFAGIDLEASLDRDTTSLDAGIRLSLTPLTSLSVVATRAVDRFVFDPTRDATSQSVWAEFAFAPDAIFRGTARVGFRRFTPDSRAVDGFQGLTSRVAIVYPFLDRGTVGVGLTRDLTYSFEQAAGYFVETTGDLSYTHRIAGAWDAQVRTAVTRMNYGEQAATLGADRIDGVRLFSLGAGYNFLDQSRLGLTYEWSRRSSDTRADRRYGRNRVFASWAYAF